MSKQHTRQLQKTWKNSIATKKSVRNGKEDTGIPPHGTDAAERVRAAIAAAQRKRAKNQGESNHD